MMLNHACSTSVQDGVTQFACCNDWTSSLSDFVDSLLASDSLLYTYACDVNARAHVQPCNYTIVDPSMAMESPATSSAVTGSTTTSVSPAYSCDHAQPLPLRQQGRQPDDFHGLQNCVRRTITNKTYLRRLYLSPQQASCLFPGIDAGSTQIKLSRKRRALVRKKIKNTTYDVDLVRSDGRRWASAFECAVSTTGQLHCRLVNGWSRFCRDNGVAVHDIVVLKPSGDNSNEIIVIVERQAG